MRIQTLSVLVPFLMALHAYGGGLNKIVPVSFSQLMKKALEAKDAPATCWYLGTAEGYIRALKDSGNKTAAQLLDETRGAEGKCGGKNTMDLNPTFTPEEWSSLSALQKKIETAQF